MLFFTYMPTATEPPIKTSAAKRHPTFFRVHHNLNRCHRDGDDDGDDGVTIGDPVNVMLILSKSGIFCTVL